MNIGIRTGYIFMKFFSWLHWGEIHIPSENGEKEIIPISKCQAIRWRNGTFEIVGPIKSEIRRMADGATERIDSFSVYTL